MVEDVAEEFDAVNGRADPPATVVGVVLEDDTPVGFVVLVVLGSVVEVVVVVVVVVVVDVVEVVDVLDVDVVVVVGQSSMVWRMPETSLKGLGPTSTSTWTTPQNSGYGTARVPDDPIAVPATGLPGTNGSLTKSTHRHTGRTIGHWVGIVNSTWPVPASNRGIDFGSCDRTAQAVPADTIDAPAANTTMAMTTSALYSRFAVMSPLQLQPRLHTGRHARSL